MDSQYSGGPGLGFVLENQQWVQFDVDVTRCQHENLMSVSEK